MAVIDSKKLLPPSKPGGAIVDSQKPFLVPVSNILYKKDVNISQKLLKSADKETQESGGSLVVIKKKVLKIKDIINNTYLIKQSEDNRKTKEKQRQRRDEREKKLETKPSGKADFNNLPKVSLPGRSILDTIKRFLFFTFVGFLFNKYSEYLPKLVEFGKYIEPVTKFIDSFAKNAINGVINFIDFGYQAYDNVSKTIKNIGGKDAEKTFTEFSTQLNLLLNGAIAAAMLIASTAPRGPKGGAGAGRRGGDFAAGYAAGYASGLASGKGIRPGAGFTDPGRYRASGQARSGGFDLERQRQALTQQRTLSPSGPRGPLDRIGRGFRGASAQLQTGTLFKKGAGIQRGLYNIGSKATQAAKGAARFGIAKVPIIGALIGFIIDTVIFREKPSRAAAGAVGSAVGQGIGLALAGGTTFGLGAGVGLFAGGFLGDIVGKSLYDAFVGVKPEPTPAKAQGGQVQGRQSDVASSRRIKTQQVPRRTIYTAPAPQPGKDFGGKLKIEELYGKDEPGKKSALRALVNSSRDLKKMKSFNGIAGGMFGAGIDMALGQKPDKKLARALGDMFGDVVTAAVDAELDSSFSSITRTIAMANGGVVPSREIGGGMSIGEKIGKYISNAFSIALESSAAKVLRNLNQELNLEGGPPGGATGPTGPDGNVPGARLRGGSNAQIEADLLEYFTAIYGKNAAIGIVANIRRESGYRTATPNNSRFEGMVQWSRNDRWPKFEKWAQSKGLDPYNRNAQAQYIAIDINNHGIGAELKSASSPEEAASIFYNKFERGAHSKPVKGNSYTPDNPHENLNKQYIAEITGRNPNIGSRSQQVVVQPQSAPSRLTSAQFKDVLPEGNPQLTSGFGFRNTGIPGASTNHQGIDIGVDPNSKVTALEDGEVVNIYPNFGGHGDGVVVKHADGNVMVYGHVIRKVKFGDKVKKGQVIALVKEWIDPRYPGPGGRTHLHLERRMGSATGAAIDPTSYLKSVAPKPPQLQSSLAPSQQSRDIAFVQQNPSYSQGGVMVVHDVNNIVMPIVSV